MKFTIDWLKQHLDTKYNDKKILVEVLALSKSARDRWML